MTIRLVLEVRTCKADIPLCVSPSILHAYRFGLIRMSHLMSLLGVKRTCLFALQMSAYDPKRTFVSVDRTRARPPSEDQLKPI
jgi:hypothetical protein